MPTKIEPKDNITLKSYYASKQSSSHDLHQREPTLGFQLVAVGLVTYILYAAKLLITRGFTQLLVS